MRLSPLLFAIPAACDPAMGRSTSLSLPFGGKPVELAAGDLDGDGRVDLVALNADGTASVRLQRDGAWRATPAALPSAAAHMVAVGDVDADGALDVIATSHDTGDVQVFRGDGTGRFRALPPVRAITVARPHNHGLVVADLDGDRRADVVVADQVAKQLAVLRSTGGTLALQATIALPAQPYPPAAGDLDGDGRLDLAVPLVSGRLVAVLLGDGRGGFGAPTTFATPRDRPYGVAIGDVDGDGKADVVVSHDDTDVIAVLPGDGRGRLGAGRAIELPRRIGRPIVADLDGDGALDIAGAGGDAS